MTFEEALTIVYTYATAARSQLEEEVIEDMGEDTKMTEEVIDEAFKVIEDRVNKHIGKGLKRMRK